MASPAFVDAYAVSTTLQNPNFCSVLNTILTPSNGFVPSTGAVIDARGLNSTNVSMTCAASPWAGITNPPPSTIQLPPGTIKIPTTWKLPTKTHLVGEGDNIASGTVIQACSTSGCFSGTTMIQFGSSTACGSACGTAVENLVLDGNGKSINGIVNSLFQDLSYVDHVSLYRILGTGLLVSGSAYGSGPYTNITFNAPAANSSTVCARINGVSTTGLHGLTCTASGTLPNAGILLDASNNSLRDVWIDGFGDGVVVGQNASATGDVLVNIQNQGPLGVTNLIHICGSNPSGAGCATHQTVNNLAIMAATTPPRNCPNGTGICVAPQASVRDDVTGNVLSTVTDDQVGMYVLGAKSTQGYYSLYSTSPRVASWAFGTAAPSGTCAQGSLYSCSGSSTNCTSGSSTAALWACLASGWTAVK